MPIHILKFGGTSMGSAQSISRCVNIIKKAERKNHVVVIVSAMHSVTNELIALAENARLKRMHLIRRQLCRLEEKHHAALIQIAPIGVEKQWGDIFAPLFYQLKSLLGGITAIGEVSDRTLAMISSFGEKLSSWLMLHALQAASLKSIRISAERIIRTDSNFLEANVDYTNTKKLCQKQLLPALRTHTIPVITGFIGGDNSGNTTLLGRGGSDYTASIVGIGLRAKRIEIWTDVDGVMSADPRLIKKAKLWKKISLNVMAEMAYSGAKVLHPKTIVAAVSYHIPVVIKNTFNPSSPGTIITSHDTNGIRGITIDREQTLFNLTNLTMLDGVGFINLCSKIFNDLKIPIDVCATSEVTFTCSINRRDYSPILMKALAKIATLDVYQTLTKICVTGLAIGSDAKIIARIFDTLDDCKIYTISSSASSNNITFFIDANKTEPALLKLHNNLF